MAPMDDDRHAATSDAPHRLGRALALRLVGRQIVLADRTWVLTLWCVPVVPPLMATVWLVCRR